MFRTLIADDEKPIRELTVRALAQCDLSCDTATNGDEAFELYQANPYDAVITDLRMPRRHGHSLAVELLRRPEKPHVLVVTAVAEPRLVRDLMSRGVDDIIHKPVEYNVLAMKVLALAERQRLADEQRAAKIAALQREQDPRLKLAAIEKGLLELTGIFEAPLAGLFDFEDDLSDPPSAVSDFITRFAQNEEQASEAVETPDHELRAEQRIRCRSSAIAVPINRRFVPDGQPFRVAIRDVSASGVRLLHTRAITADCLALCWSGETVPTEEIRVAAEVMRCDPLSPFYDLGCRFITSE